MNLATYRARLQCTLVGTRRAHTPITVFTESDPTLSSLASAMSTILRGMPREAEIYRTVSQRRRPRATVACMCARVDTLRLYACTRHAMETICLHVAINRWLSWSTFARDSISPLSDASTYKWRKQVHLAWTLFAFTSIISPQSKRFFAKLRINVARLSSIVHKYTLWIYVNRLILRTPR